MHGTEQRWAKGDEVVQKAPGRPFCCPPVLMGAGEQEDEDLGGPFLPDRLLDDL